MDERKLEKMRTMRTRAEVAARTNIESASARAHAESLATEAQRLKEEIEREQLAEEMARATPPKPANLTAAVHGRGKKKPVVKSGKSRPTFEERS